MDHRSSTSVILHIVWIYIYSLYIMDIFIGKKEVVDIKRNHQRFYGSDYKDYIWSAFHIVVSFYR